MVPSLKLTKTPLKIVGFSNRKGLYSNHPFSGAFAVSFREGRIRNITPTARHLQPRTLQSHLTLLGFAAKTIATHDGSIHGFRRNVVVVFFPVDLDQLLGDFFLLVDFSSFAFPVWLMEMIEQITLPETKQKHI